MREERVAKEELLQAARSQGILFLSQVEAIVLEKNGKFSIIKTAPQGNESTLRQVNKID